MNRSKIKPGYLYSKIYTNYIFALLFLLYMFDYIDRMVVTSMFEYIQHDWGITNAQSGLLVSVIYWSIAALTFPASFFVDRWSRKKTIGWMAVVWSIATILCAFTGNFAQLILARIIIGVGEAGYAPGGTAMIAGLYPENKRARMIGLWNASIPLGSAIGVALGGYIAATWGWKHAFGIVAIPGMVVAILFFFIREYKTVPLVSSNDTKTGTNQGKIIMREFTQKPTIIFTSFGMTAIVFVTTAMITWLPKYFSEMYHLGTKQAAFKAGAIFLLAIIGAPLGGFITDWWRKTKIGARLYFPALSTALAALLLFLAFQLEPGNQQYMVLLAFGVLVSAFIPGASAATQDVVHAGLRATAYSITVFVQNLLGASFGPVIIGILIDRWEIQNAMIVLPFILLAGAVLFLIGSGFYVKDLKKVQIVELEAE